MTINPGLQQAMNALREGRFAAAESILTDILAVTPHQLQARWSLIQTLERQEKSGPAQEHLRLLLLHVKKDLSAIDQLANHYRQKRYPLKHILKAYKAYLTHRPSSANAAFNYAYNLARDAQFETAISMYKRSLELGISAPEEVHLNIANIYMDHLHEHGQAKSHLEQALSLNPRYASAFYNLGNLAEQEGERQKASESFKSCLKADPANESALARLADTRTFKDIDDPLIKQLVAAAARTQNSDVSFALGKAYEQLRQFAMAWEQFAKGNALDQRGMPAYSREKTEAMFRRIRATCDRQWVKKYTGSPHAPIFICGMFRTGSTLLEQVLAAHPAFVAGGESEFFPRLVAREFPDYPNGLEGVSDDLLGKWRAAHFQQMKKLFGGTSRLTDKRPDNFLYIGLIKAVLPQAKFIVTERDWRDVATSIFSVRLGPSQAYATSLDDIHHYIKLQTELIDHWSEVLGPDIYRIRYEDLVSDIESAVSGLLSWLGESWDDRCLDFHRLRNSVKTASVWQVREPLHPRSVGRWKNYEAEFNQAFGGTLPD